MTQTTESEPVVSEESLDSIIEQYKPQPVAVAPAAPAAPVQVASAPTVDPLDETSMNNYVQSVNNGQSVLNNQLQDVQAKLTHMEEQSTRLQVDADINDAVSRINEGLNIEPKRIRVELELKAQENPGFKAIWDNRKENPEAYTKTLNALSRELGETYSVRTDSELVANQKAVQQSQQSRSTTNAQDVESPLEDRLKGAKSGGEFNAEWQRLIGG